MGKSQGTELLPGVFALDTALWMAKDKALVLADLHLGLEEAFNRQGVLLPRFNFEDIKKRLEKKVFPKAEPEIIIINGDLKHEFGKISEQEWHEVIEMLRLLQAHCKRTVLIRGNHDKILGPIAKWEGLSIEEEGLFLEKSRVFVSHGETIPSSAEFKKAKTIAIGHEHPAVTIRERYKREQFKCFLVGKFKDKSLIVQPSMNAVSIGTDVKRQQLLSPFLRRSIETFRVFAVADKVYDFGKLGALE
ncbi:MAG: metallophosphoesterase [Candidatus Diapherotrites archaeon]|nr:metallophosphoesterase [Candidatus Diapherotrites archaeon]